MKFYKSKLFKEIMLLLVLTFTLYFLSGSDAKEMDDYSFSFAEPGEGKTSERLDACIEGVLIQDIEVTVNERKYTDAEIKEFEKTVREALIKCLLNQNTDLTKVSKDLSFPEKIDGYPFAFSYETKGKGNLSDTGEILNANEFIETIKIKYSYYEFSNSFSIKVRVDADLSVKARVYKSEIQAMLGADENVTDDGVTLPREVDGKSVSYRVPAKERNPLILLLGPAASVLLILGNKRDEIKKSEKRKKQILTEYPVLVSKMSLYLATGMTLRNIFIRIYEEGLIKKEIDNPLYREMGVSVNELHSGVSEGLVYKHFGERTGVNELIRFTALLSQNLKKGSSKLKDLLSEELDKAYTNRKQRAIKLGEEAGTKLLLPMMLLLIDVLIMIMVPAFFSL